MAWHSGKPADNDFLSASVQHIRENFAELEPLQPHVAELVDLTALQPHVAELVDLTALQPHIAALLDSRIVEHNLDLADPSNGYYVRWENGLQVCWKTGLLAQYNNSNRLATGWVFPAEFADADYSLSLMPVWVSGDMATYSTTGRGFYIDEATKSTDGVWIWVLVGSAESGDTIHVDALAVGRWAES